eukprot:scaffold191869_cov29-Tisochrysis_lutea.AAC.4
MKLEVHAPCALITGRAAAALLSSRHRRRGNPSLPSGRKASGAHRIGDRGGGKPKGEDAANLPLPSQQESALPLVTLVIKGERQCALLAPAAPSLAAPRPQEDLARPQPMCTKRSTRCPRPAPPLRHCGTFCRERFPEAVGSLHASDSTPRANDDALRLPPQRTV